MARVFRRASQWWIDFNDANGKRRRIKVGPQKRIAQEVLNNYLAKVARREHLGVIADSDVDFATYAAQWLAGLRPDLAEASRVSYAGALKHLTAAFTGKLRAITPVAVKQYVAARVESGASPSTINRETTLLKVILKQAVRDQTLGRNPLANAGDEIRPLRMPAQRVRYLAPGEVDRLLEACRASPYLHEFVLVLLNTGCRRNEVLNLTYAQIDWSNRLVHLTATKTHEPRVVYFNQTAFAALQGLPRRLDGKLWPFTPNAVTMAFIRAARKANLADFRLHDCRHHSLSMLAMKGVNQVTLMAVAGHRNLSTASVTSTCRPTTCAGSQIASKSAPVDSFRCTRCALAEVLRL
jgi:integrase